MAVNNQLQQERNFFKERRDQVNLLQRRAENEQDQENVDRSFDEGVFRDRRDFAFAEEQTDFRNDIATQKMGLAYRADSRADKRLSLTEQMFGPRMNILRKNAKTAGYRAETERMKFDAVKDVREKQEENNEKVDAMRQDLEVIATNVREAMASGDYDTAKKEVAKIDRYGREAEQFGIVPELEAIRIEAGVAASPEEQKRIFAVAEGSAEIKEFVGKNSEAFGLSANKEILHAASKDLDTFVKDGPYSKSQTEEEKAEIAKERTALWNKVNAMRDAAPSEMVRGVARKGVAAERELDDAEATARMLDGQP